jgi:hypothetical protein
MDRAELMRIATKLRRETRNPEVIALCDAVLVLVPVQATEVRYVSKWREANREHYRDYMREYMRRQRQAATALSS